MLSNTLFTVEIPPNVNGSTGGECSHEAAPPFAVFKGWVLDRNLDVHPSHLFLPMPPCLHRHYGTGHLHFITSSCFHQWPLLGTISRRNLFLKILEQVRLRYSFVVVGYVVMPEHIHLLISEPDRGTPSTVMQVLKQRFARRVLSDWRRRETPDQSRLWQEALEAGHVWQRRFYDFVVRSEEKKIEKLKYIYRNPVKRGLVLEPDQWAWSSFRCYAHGERGPVLVNERRRAEMKMRNRETFVA